MPHPPIPEPGEDPALRAELERALEPYREVLPPEMLQHFRETLADALTTHPVAARLLERVRPPPVVDASGELERAGAPAASDEDDEAKGRAG